MIRRVLLVAAAGCYAPDVRDCAYACTAQADCPDDTICDVIQGACRIDGASGMCGGSAVFSPTNYTFADLAAVTAGDLDLTTTQAVDADTIVSARLLETGMLLVHLHALVVPAGASIQVNAGEPVIFAVDGDVDISGQLLQVGGRAACAADIGTSGATCGGGGGGGGFAGAGGPGGDCMGVAGGAPIDIGAMGLVPLRGGCDGGNGGSITDGSMSGGIHGNGGGAIEISTPGTISISGELSTPGHGGKGGQLDVASPNTAPAGGGGGGGGGIFLEAPLVEIAGFVCAAGGGGGGAEFNEEGAMAGMDGGDACIIDQPGLGGTSFGGGTGAGGDGGGSTSLGAGDGSAGVPGSGPDGGGGGGGGVGLIEIRANHLDSGMGILLPPAS